MRVMYVSATGELGGAERMLIDLLACVREARPAWPLHLVTCGDGPLTISASSLGVACTTVPLPAPFERIGEAGVRGRAWGRLGLAAQLAGAAFPLAAFVHRLRRVIAAFGPDVVHTHSLKMHVPAAWAAGRAACVWHLHDYVSRRPISAKLLGWNASLCDAAVAPSKSAAVDAQSVLNRPVQAVANGIDLERFTESGARADLDALAGLPPAPPGTVRVGLLGTFARWKGHITFLEALARLPSLATLRGYVVGAPLYRTQGSQTSLDRLRERADRLGLSGRVGFTGLVGRPEDAIRSLDVVVHASVEPEPFGLVIAEAMACGRAVIASDAGGATELYTPGVDALGHRAGDSADLAACLGKLVRDAELRRRLGAAARGTAHRRFDRRRMASEVLDIYEHAAG
jgi:glycosyltransferase involved in cell wall biosynthesis